MLHTNLSKRGEVPNRSLPEWETSAFVQVLRDELWRRAEEDKAA